MTTDTIPDDLISIREAANILRRSPSTLRRWDRRRGKTPSGARLRSYRDGVTLIRWYSRADIERIRQSLWRVVVD